jgi:hypothetical protein
LLLEIDSREFYVVGSLIEIKGNFFSPHFFWVRDSFSRPLVVFCFLEDAAGKDVSLGVGICSTTPAKDTNGHWHTDSNTPNKIIGSGYALNRAIRAVVNQRNSEHMVKKARKTLEVCGVISSKHTRTGKRLPVHLKWMSVWLGEVEV